MTHGVGVPAHTTVRYAGADIAPPGRRDGDATTSR